MQQATVVLEPTLLRMPRREPIATARFEKTTPVAADSIYAVLPPLTRLSQRG